MSHRKQAPPRQTTSRSTAQALASPGQRIGRLNSAHGFALPGVPPIVHEVLQAPGQPLDAVTRALMEPRFGHDFSQVRVHTDARADASAQAADALAYTVGRDVVFGAGQYAPGTRAGQQILAHELTHVVQQTRAAGSGIPRPLRLGRLDDPAEREAAAAVHPGGVAVRSIITSEAPVLRRQPRQLSDIPQAERRALQVSTIEITVPAATLNEVFPSAANNHRPQTSYSVGDQTVFGSTVPANLQRGLQSVGGYLAGHTNALPLNSTISLTLDLTPYGGTNAIYRFTFFRHTERRSTSDILLIELVGPAPAAPTAVTATAGPFTVRGHTFTLGSGWTDARFGILQQAIGLLPDAALTAADGLTFTMRSGTGPTGEAGHYNQDQDTIELFDNAFPTSDVRFGTSDRAVWNVVHEIGHALDLRPLARAWQAFNAAGQTPGAERRFLATRSRSGTRYVAPAQPGGNYTEDLALDDRSGDFRQAVQSDGVRRDTSGRVTGSSTTASLSGGVTDYSDTDYQEVFAESYALYITDPNTLRLLRPNTYRYFERRYRRRP